MANPSSSHHDRDRERERVVRERSHHHHRTISSTTLLLILSLVLAVLAVMLSLPSTRLPGAAGGTSNPVEAVRGAGGDSITNGAGLWGSFFNPRRSEALISREHAVAKRESEVAQREADILAGALVTCQPYATITEYIETMAPVQTVYKEVIHHSESAVAVTVPVTVSAPAPSPTTDSVELTRRIEDIIQRESKIAEREKDMSRREEVVNRREHDAQRREAWIMEQLIALGTDPQMVEEEYIVEQPAKRKIKAYPITEKIVAYNEDRPAAPPPPPKPIVTSTIKVAKVAPPPASTRPAEFPLPVSFSLTSELPTFPTTVQEIIFDNAPEPVYVEEEEEPEMTTTVRRRPVPPQRRRGW